MKETAALYVYPLHLSCWNVLPGDLSTMLGCDRCSAHISRTFITTGLSSLEEEKNREQNVGGCHLETGKTEITRLPKLRADGGQQQRPEK